ncbi:hypothetical protein CONLIGDRAFT_679717 [Coniochaeta ligniaria NRRL 30616]|uniref:DEAD/DEAH-box helicase domain-containing protein n=1 Tax=Coniochaeta ligniaria NRRL 30616 TaxID=1408157 RepID=A0A1J7ITZ0_9PEZI|nr:hypothetical protein CONLIGDRAFT_679717 [Coniochaeta ligniaria NRRL 30616]
MVCTPVVARSLANKFKNFKLHLILYNEVNGHPNVLKPQDVFNPNRPVDSFDAYLSRGNSFLRESLSKDFFTLHTVSPDPYKADTATIAYAKQVLVDAKLRSHQLQVLTAIGNGTRDFIYVVGTSRGKSVAYQIPALDDSLGQTVVIQPLKALQLQTKEKLASRGIEAPKALPKAEFKA